MNLSEKIIKNDITVKETKTIAKKLLNAYMMCENLIKYQSCDWENKTIEENEEIMKNNNIWLLYSEITFQCITLTYCRRRSRNMLEKFEKAYTDLKANGLNTY